MYICTVCHKDETQVGFYKGRHIRCKRCEGKYKYYKHHDWYLNYSREYWKKSGKDRSEYYKNWYKTHGRKRTEKDNKIGREWYKNNPPKVRAKYMVREAVLKGKMSKPEFCFYCKKEKKLFGHHPDYSKPLNVIWLCGSCHKKLHTGIVSI